MATYFIGTDEAGYGPNLGPLVVTATVWQLPDHGTETDFYELLAKVACRPTREQRKTQLTPDSELRLEIGDSKRLYSGGSDLSRLELAIWSLLATLRPLPETLDAAWEALAPGSLEQRTRCPWHEDRLRPFPHSASPAHIAGWTMRLIEEFQNTNLRLVTARSQVIFPEQWNELLDQWEGKAEVLSRTTLNLVQATMSELPEGPVVVQCDKHGGRNRYGPLLQTVFPEDWLEVIQESRELSIYRGGEAEGRREFRFAMRGEENLAVALASMTSKYLRELAMHDFNTFWCSRLEGLRPTAGYPVDARRFHGEIAALQQHLGIPDAAIWRRK